MTSFMQHATEYGTFYVGETTEGTTILHRDVFETEKRHYKLLRGERWEKRRGWYARLSAPGYLDSTDWTGPFDSEKEAHAFLNEMYGGE